VVFDYPTVEALSDHLATILPELVEAADAEAVDAYEDLSDDDLLKELSERLG
jgi:phthiocerol/phenolphthiocerol synthesis type-I polyketide synthase B